MLFARAGDTFGAMIKAGVAHEFGHIHLGPGQGHEVEFACDDYAAELLGDPLPVVLLLQATRMWHPNETPSRTHPTISERIASLRARYGVRAEIPRLV